MLLSVRLTIQALGKAQNANVERTGHQDCFKGQNWKVILALRGNEKRDECSLRARLRSLGSMIVKKAEQKLRSRGYECPKRQIGRSLSDYGCLKGLKE